MRQYVTGYETARGYIRDIWYDNGLDAASIVVDISGNCYQYMKVR